MSDRINHDDALRPRPWMRPVLRIAGVYNLLWGIWVVCFPLQSLRFLGLDPPPIYPEFWQCVGMVVGVYGVGYWIAANDPFRHWPIVLVGFLGKLLGPIGMVSAIVEQRLPASMAAVSLTNDLVWWIPFGLILFEAARAAHTTRSLAETGGSVVDQHGQTFDDVVRTGKTVVVFLRHSGCTFCREALATVARTWPQWSQAGYRLAFVHVETESPAVKEFFTFRGIEDAHRFGDPALQLFRRYGLPLGTFRQLFGPRVWKRGFETCVIRGHGVGTSCGNGFQLGGAVLIEDGVVRARQIASDASWLPDISALIHACGDSTASN